MEEFPKNYLSDEDLRILAFCRQTNFPDLIGKTKNKTAYLAGLYFYKDTATYKKLETFLERRGKKC